MDGEPRAKEPISSVLAGPYAHPFHPILVTVPIGAWVASVVFDVASRVNHGSSDALALGARWLLALGVLGALAAACVGFLDFLLIPAGTPVHRTAVRHMVLNLAITVGFAASFAWRLGANGPTAVGPLALSVVCLALLAVSGTLGGKLAYRYGVRVAADRVQAHGFEPVGGDTGSSHEARPSASSKGA
jgi:uncharacterized membrane protein